ncbi:hypothetical protein RchiOBHm_Chr3g0464231 [Rosa chinensis]|uniref:PAR1 protein n=1 Tax=Rosa chinensis TaxID=74649 RepID=A0A2P6R9G6_ROSCH|nr:hypothetical protein RchiOBHm_Chr3g0464231 [Rosa chinensis]
MDKQCRTSEVVVDKMAEYIETDECVKACGVDRDAVGISSDAFLEPHFLNKLCTRDCYEKCSNLVELYLNLAAGEGVFLPYLCVRQRSEPHRTKSSSAVSGPASEQVEAGGGPITKLVQSVCLCICILNTLSGFLQIISFQILVTGMNFVGKKQGRNTSKIRATGKVGSQLLFHTYQSYMSSPNSYILQWSTYS